MLELEAVDVSRAEAKSKLLEQLRKLSSFHLGYSYGSEGVDYRGTERWK